jgi:hypothetical protein
MGKKYTLLIVFMAVITIGTTSAKDIVVCGTVTDVVDTNVTAIPCSVSVHVGCSATDGDLYFAKTNSKGSYSLTVNLPDTCTDNFLIIFNGKKQDRSIATIQVNMPRSSVVDTLRQNLQLQNSQPVTIDETMPDNIPAEVIADWKDQDKVFGTDYAGAINAIVNKLPLEYADKYNAKKAGFSGEKLYLLACHYRRVSRMKKHEADLKHVMFARHHNFGGTLIGIHDNSDAGNTDKLWVAKGALCVLNMENYYSPSTELLKRDSACVRDPCISFDGKKVLFAMSGSSKGSGYKIYEMDISNLSSPGTPKQLTFDDQGLSDRNFTVADFEPCYLPNGDIMFTSTRNFGLNTHAYNPTTNMFLMDSGGKYMRQVGFDQVNTFYPVLMDDGTVLYTRWEFNDRSQINCIGLFTMNPDGCHQTEYFGNQTSWPLSQIHARPIPHTYGSKVMCVAGGFHGPYAGELMIINRTKGADGLQSITMIAPQRDTKPDVKKSDMAAGDVNFLFQTPCPLDTNDFLVSWRKSESDSSYNNYKLYFMDINGNRELLAWADQSVSQPVLMKSRTIPPCIVQMANYSDSLGSFAIQNVYIGAGMQGIDSSTHVAKKIRVVALHYRAAGSYGNFGQIMGSGPSGTFIPPITCPVSAFGASWDAKEVLGEAKIYDDGSAAFKVPARTPVYFQVLDSMGYCIATMRSWSTLMPGEKFSCGGCHEKIQPPPPPSGGPLAGAPKPLEAPLGIENKPFDYGKMVQPIFNNHCVECHTASHESGFDLTGTLVSNANAKKSFTKSYNSLLSGIPVKTSNSAINICTIFSPPEQQPPRSFGSSLSGIMTKGGMSGSHHDVQVTDTERKIVACWIDLCAPHAGNYNSYMSASDSINYQKLLDKREKWAAIERENIKEFLDAKTGVIPNDRHGVKFTSSATDPRIVYVPAKQTLVLNHPDRGNFMLVDLRGRVVYRMEITDRCWADVLIPLPPSLAWGLYVARFIGDGLTLQRLVTIIR